MKIIIHSAFNKTSLYYGLFGKDSLESIYAFIIKVFSLWVFPDLFLYRSVPPPPPPPPPPPSQVAPILKAKMMEAGSLMVQYQPLGKLPNLFRVAVSNPALNRKDLDFLLEEMDNLGHDIPTPADW